MRGFLLIGIAGVAGYVIWRHFTSVDAADAKRQLRFDQMRSMYEDRFQKQLSRCQDARLQNAEGWAALKMITDTVSNILPPAKVADDVMYKLVGPESAKSADECRAAADAYRALGNSI